jgi:hypothetical protein
MVSSVTEEHLPTAVGIAQYLTRAEPAIRQTHPSDRKAMTKLGVGQGFSRVDVFDSERMVQLLNTPAGLAARHQFLDIPLSKAEQRAFFGHFGDGLANLVSRNHTTLVNQLERMEYIFAISRPLQQISFRARFAAPVLAKDLVGCAGITFVSSVGDHPHGWAIGGVASVAPIDLHELVACTSPIYRLAAGRQPLQRFLDQRWGWKPALNELCFSPTLAHSQHLVTPATFDGLWCTTLLSARLAELRPAISIEMNGYCIATVPTHDLQGSPPPAQWPLDSHDIGVEFVWKKCGKSIQLDLRNTLPRAPVNLL